VNLVVLGRFALVSLVGTGLDFLVLWLLVARAGWTPVPAKAIALEVTIINTFVLNNVWTFRDRAVSGALLLRFVSFNIAGGARVALDLATIALLVALFGPHYYLLYNIATLPLNFALNYLWSARVVWRGSTTALDAERHSDGEATAVSPIADRTT